MGRRAGREANATFARVDQAEFEERPEPNGPTVAAPAPSRPYSSVGWTMAKLVMSLLYRGRLHSRFEK